MILNDFQKNFMKQLNFISIHPGFKTTYSDASSPDKGFITYYEKKEAYTLVYASYKIDQAFQLDFNAPVHHLRFGLVEEGVAEYQIQNKPTTNFKPAPFIAIEENLTGTQRWRKYQHYSGIEVFIEIPYLIKLSRAFPRVKKLLRLPTNNALLYLPLDVIDLLKTLIDLINKDKLTPLLLEGKIFECIALINQSFSTFSDTALDELFLLNGAKKSMDKSLLTTKDVETIKVIKHLLQEKFHNPPTIQEICSTFFINEQKLTLGFKNIYQMTIGNYLKDLRISEAANLLSTTDLSVEEIALKVGYSHASNLSKVFKKKYHRTPLQYRKTI